MAKVLLITNGVKMENIEEPLFDLETGVLMFRCGNKKYKLMVEESIGTFIKIYEDGRMEMINKVAQCICIEKKQMDS